MFCAMCTFLPVVSVYHTHKSYTRGYCALNPAATSGSLIAPRFINGFGLSPFASLRPVLSNGTYERIRRLPPMREVTVAVVNSPPSQSMSTSKAPRATSPLRYPCSNPEARRAINVKPRHDFEVTSRLHRSETEVSINLERRVCVKHVRISTSVRIILFHQLQHILDNLISMITVEQTCPQIDFSNR